MEKRERKKSVLRHCIDPAAVHGLDLGSTENAGDQSLSFYGLPGICLSCKIDFFFVAFLLFCSHGHSQLFRALQEMRKLVECSVLEPLLVRCLVLDLLLTQIH